VLFPAESGKCDVSGEGCETVYYELSGVISHILDADDSPEAFEEVRASINHSTRKAGASTQAAAAAAREEGHLVLCIKVLLACRSVSPINHVIC
jgi:hypothetical protein